MKNKHEGVILENIFVERERENFINPKGKLKLPDMTLNTKTMR